MATAPRTAHAEALLRVEFKDNPVAPYDDAMARRESRLPLRLLPGVYLVAWTGAHRSGTQRLSAL